MGTRIRRIMDAQRSRGIDLRPRLRNIPNFVALLMPLLVQSFVLAEQLAMAMESRGFSRKGRTLRRNYRITGKNAGEWRLLWPYLWYMEYGDNISMAYGGSP